MLATEDRPSVDRTISSSPRSVDATPAELRRAYDDGRWTLVRLADAIYQNGYVRLPDISNLSKYLRGVKPVPPRMRRDLEEVLGLRPRTQR